MNTERNLFGDSAMWEVGKGRNEDEMGMGAPAFRET